MSGRAEDEDEAAPPPLDAGAILAAAIGKAKGRGQSDARFDAFLDEQTSYLRSQSEHLDEQRDLQIAHLRARRWRDRMEIGLQALAGFVLVVAVAALGTMMWQAHEDRGLVIDAFSVPPDLAQRGLTGQVAAAKVLDKLTALQVQTDSARAPNTYVNNWGDDIKVEIPDVGVSIGELNRYLRQWLGHETHISGEIVRTASGLSVTARTGGESGTSFEGPDADLDRLFQQAAEDVYRRTQPYRYGAFLINHSRIPEARAVFEQLMAAGAPAERKWAALGLVNVSLFVGDVAVAEREHQALARRYPDFVMAINNVAGDGTILDHEEAALAASRENLRMAPDGINPDVTRNAGSVMAKSSEVSIAEFTGDFVTAARLDQDLIEMPDYGGSSASNMLSKGSDLAFAHQPSAAAAALDEAHPPPGAAMAFLQGFTAEVVGLRMLADIERQDWHAAVARGAQLAALTKVQPDPFTAIFETRILGPWRAYAMAMAGDAAGADALIADAPNDADTVLRMRGRIAAAKGDWAGAARWFARATAQAPSIPMPYADWGQMLLAKGDVDGAIAKLQTAHAMGPHYADALELWGEALARRGDLGGAVAKFKAAAAAAPGWGRNHLRWGEALWRLGRSAEARAQFLAARGLDLSAGDTAAVNVFIARVDRSGGHG